VPKPDGEEQAVVVIQCREADVEKRQNLVDRMDRAIRAELGVDCIVDLVPLHTLIRTSSGKLSRFRTREDFIERTNWGKPSQMLAAG
tara:strand:+ start:134 stop:394 length:261 start_codon:yes stop_codon:yes gene_type:complete